MSTPALLCWDGSLTLLLFFILSYYAQLRICTAFLISAAFSSRVNVYRPSNPGDGVTRAIQGPSIETLDWIYADRSESGYDHGPLYPLSVLAARRGGMAPTSSSLRLADSGWYHSNQRFRLPSRCRRFSSLSLQRNGMADIVFQSRSVF